MGFLGLEATRVTVHGMMTPVEQQTKGISSRPDLFRVLICPLTHDVFCERQDANGFQNLRTVFFGVPQGCLPPKQRSGFCERVH